jgi:Ankyrin repeats (3 copies)
MSATAKQLTGANAATQELWRLAESGEVGALSRVFASGAHVNARNKHGMTPLMKAASEGHAQMVRALLERGADPNLARNDKFTALALAAFFGHTEIVKTLIAHGARTEVITRCGASAETWAIRRTFDEAARCLETKTTKPAPAPQRAAVAPVAIKTLKDPPEIWDLVHEEPRGFDARSAFLTRLKSMRTSFALRAAAVVVVSAACVVSVLVFRGSQARSLPVDVPASQSAVATEATAPVNVENTKTETPADQSTTEANQFSHHSGSPGGVDDKPSRKVVLTRQTRARAVPEEERPQSVQSKEVLAAPVIAAPQVETRKPANAANTSLSPQLIAPAKSAPPKGKVIQWP